MCSLCRRMPDSAPHREPIGKTQLALDERELFARIRDGDEHAFEVVFRAHFDRLSRIASAMLAQEKGRGE